MIVIDASALVELLLRTPVSAEDIASRLLEPDQGVCAPHLIDLEVTQALRRAVASSSMPEARARDALADLAALPLRRYGHRLFLSRIWELRDNFTAYDAMYVALAEALDAPFLTRDRGLAAAIASHTDVKLA